MSKENEYGDKIPSVKAPVLNKEVKVETTQEVTTSFPSDKRVAEPVQESTRFNATPYGEQVDELTVPEERIKSAMETYLNKIRSSENENESGRCQMFLFNLLKTIITNEDYNEFRVEWNNLLNFVNKNKSEINALTINRFLTNTDFDADDFSLFTTITFLITTTSDPAVRFKKLNVCANYTTSKLAKLGQVAQSNINNFYNFS